MNTISMADLEEKDHEDESHETTWARLSNRDAYEL